MSYSLIEAKCNDCDFYTHSFFEAQIQRLSEEHMMETGHTVKIEGD